MMWPFNFQPKYFAFQYFQIFSGMKTQLFLTANWTGHVLQNSNCGHTVAFFVWGNMMVINNCMQKCSVHEAHGEKIWRNIHFKKLMYRQCRPYFTSIHFNIIQTINIPTEILNLWKEIFLSLFLWKETPKLFVKGVYQLLSVANSLSAAEPTDFLCCNTANYNQLLNMVSIQQSTLACAKLCQSEYSV